MYWFSDPNCVDSLFTDQVAETSTEDLWVALSGNRTAPAAARSFLFGHLGEKFEAGGSYRAHFDKASIGRVTGPCLPSDGVLCLADSRFKVAATWRQPSGATGRHSPWP